MNFYSIFYWLTVSDGVKHFFDSASTWFAWFLTFSTIGYIVFSIWAFICKNQFLLSKTNGLPNGSKERKLEFELAEYGRKIASKFFYLFLICTLITWFGYVAVPSKKDCIMIVAGGAIGNFMTQDSSAKHIPSDVMNYLHLSIKSEIDKLTDDEKKEIGIQTPKDKLMEKAKTLSKDEFIKYLNSDTTKIGS